jgi:hypothetical protein
MIFPNRRSDVEYIVCIPSALAPNTGAVSLEDRLEQTLVGIQSIRAKFPNVFIIMADCSVLPADEQRAVVTKNIDVFIDHSNNDINRQLSEIGLKSHSELIMFGSMFNWIKENQQHFPNLKRIFKVGGRMKVSDEFDIKDYESDNVKDKYVFKKPLNSWISPEFMLYENRLWSLDISLLDDYLSKIQDMYNSFDGQFDIEHTYYKHLDPAKVELFDDVWVEGIMALYGTFVKD